MKTPDQLQKEIDEHINQLRGMRDGMKIENPEMTIQTLTPTELFLLGYIDVLERRIQNADSEIDKLIDMMQNTDSIQTWVKPSFTKRPPSKENEHPKRRESN